MTLATVTVQFVNDPKPGKKKGSIKATDGNYYWVWADKLSAYEKGGTYEINYDERDGFKTIAAMTPKAAPSTPAPNGAPGYKPATNGNTYRETSARDAERMFVCSLLNAFIKSGKLGLAATDIIEATDLLRDVWAQSFGQSEH